MEKKPINQEYIYPEDDFVHNLCREIKPEVKKGFYEGDIGNFLALWSDFENNIKYNKELKPINTYINNLKKDNKINNKIYNELQTVRLFRNNLVHDFNKIDKSKVKVYENILRNVIEEIDI